MSAAEPFTFHPSWPEAGRRLLERAIDRHGGFSRWMRLESVRVRPLWLRGLLPLLKGHPRSFPLPASITSFPKRWRTELAEYPARGMLGVFEAGDVFVVDRTTQRTVLRSRDHRRTFRGLRKYRRWRPLDALYFFGYAFAGYSAQPFLLSRCRFLESTSGFWSGERLDGVRVELPPELAVHSRVQCYFFDRSGLLRRNDYVADIVGSWARAAHCLDDYVESRGFFVPRHRTVLPRLGRRYVGAPAALEAAFDDVTVELVDHDSA